MHRAKGLEFDEVILLATPVKETGESTVSHQQRLQYVAITRAKKLASVIRID
jgi:superfamily I DNA/RNA helicase